MKARKEAQQADVVVVNHHLFFADVALKDSGIAELLPSANTVIFDEAHQLPDTATLFFGDTFSTSQVLELCRDVLAEGLSQARDGAGLLRDDGAVAHASVGEVGGTDLAPQVVERRAVGPLLDADARAGAMHQLARLVGRAGRTIVAQYHDFRVGNRLADRIGPAVDLGRRQIGREIGRAHV